MNSSNACTSSSATIEGNPFSPVSEGASDQNTSGKSISTAEKIAVMTNPSTFRSNNGPPESSARKSPKSARTNDWRLSLHGVIPKWEYLLENRLFTDVTFLVGPSKEIIKCHSLVLKMSSRHFENALTPGKQEYELPNCSPAIFHKMLKYLYTDKLEFSADDAMEAIILAKQFYLVVLQAKCGRIILEGLNENNAAVLLKKADDVGDKQLSIRIQEYILHHASQVVFTPEFTEISITSLVKLLSASRTMWKMSEDKILEAVKIWASEECSRRSLQNTGPNQYIVAKEALEHIQFTSFTPMQFTSLVVKPKLLPAEKMLEIQSELIERHESTKSEYSGGSPSQEDSQDKETLETDSRSQDKELPESSHISNSLVRSNSPSQIPSLSADIDTVYAVSRYSMHTPKDWQSDNQDGTYKITFSASKEVNLVGLGLYGRGNEAMSFADIFVKFMSYDEDTTHLEFETKAELPEEGGEFELKLNRPMVLNRLEWYTVSILINARVCPTGIGGKRNYNVEINNGETVQFCFKNSKNIYGATHVRGQMPKLFFTVPSLNS